MQSCLQPLLLPSVSPFLPLQTMLSESSIVASAMVFMAEDIQKQLSGRGLSLPLDVINNVVANEV